MYLPGKKFRHIPVVIEFGTYLTRAGFAGEDLPQTIIPTDTGVTSKGEYSQLDFNYSVAPSDIEKVKNPYENDIIVNWDIIEYQLEKIIEEQYQFNFKETPILIVESHLHNKEQRQKMVDLVFEKLRMASVFLHKSAALQSYVFAKENMLLIDSGGQYTYCVPIIEGQINQKGQNQNQKLFTFFSTALLRSKAAGDYLTQQVIKNIQGRVKINPRFKNCDQISKELFDWGVLEVIREVKHHNCKILDYRIDYLKFNKAVDNQIYILPDGGRLEMSREIYEIPELLFNSKEKDKQHHTLQAILQTSLEKCPLDHRKELLQNITVLGGTSMLNNFLERLQKEVYDLSDFGGLQHKAKVYTATGYNDQHHAAWLGGSILASMHTFDNIAMTRAEWEEHGSILVDRKCMS